MKRSLWRLAVPTLALLAVFAVAHHAHAYSAFPDPLNNADVPILVNRLVTAVLGIVGALFFVMFLWGGFQYMTAGGDAGKVKAGRTTLINAIIGIGLIVCSYAIVGNILGWIWVGVEGQPDYGGDQATNATVQNAAPATPSDFSTPN